MSNEIVKKVFACEETRQKLLSGLLKDREMVKGSFCAIYVKCGKKNCHCNSDKGHPHKRMSLCENGKAFSRAVPREEYDWIQEKTDSFREYRGMRRQLEKLEKEIHELLDCREEEITNRCKKGKPYLNVSDSEAKPKKASETTHKREKKK